MSSDPVHPGSDARARASRPVLASAAALDAALVLAFSVLGRRSHAEALTIAGIWETAWPFLAGLAISWLAALVWRRPTAVLRAGVPVWIGTVALGLLLRVLFTPGGAALPFVLVATGTLGIMLLGWRVIAAVLVRLRRR